jgi:hypothetical protein
MNKYEKGLAALDELFANTTAEEFEKDYLAVESNMGIKVKDYLNQECSKLVINSEKHTPNLMSIDIPWPSSRSNKSDKYQVEFSSFLVNKELKACNDTMQELAA